MVKKLFISLLFLNFFSGYCQLKPHQFEQIDSLQQLEKRNIVVFFHTDWCKFCKAMKNSTFKNSQIEAALNNKFYFIDFNAEQKQVVIFDNRTFKYKNNGISSGIHEIAFALASEGKQLNFPAIVILNPKNEIIFRYNGFLNAVEFLKILKKF